MLDAFHSCWLARKDRRLIVQLHELCVLHIYIVSAWHNVSIHTPEELLGNLAISVVVNDTTVIATIFWVLLGFPFAYWQACLALPLFTKLLFLFINKYKIISY